MLLRIAVEQQPQDRHADGHHPVTMKATCQPHVRDSQITRGGAIMAPTELPVLTQPVAIERSWGGNQTVDGLDPGRDRGRLADAEQCPEPAIDCQLPAKAWSAQPSPRPGRR